MATPEPTLKNKTILVIEDEESLQEVIKIKLSKQNCNYIPAVTAEAGLKYLEEHDTNPDLIWLDLLLPGMGGFAFLEHIRKQDKWKNIPVVIVSVSAGPEKIKHAFELNIVDYLIKSQYRIDDIISRVKFYIDARAKK